MKQKYNLNAKEHWTKHDAISALKRVLASCIENEKITDIRAYIAAICELNKISGDTTESGARAEISELAPLPAKNILQALGYEER